MVDKIINTKQDLGFTLIEVTLSILLFGGSLVILLGLQSSSVQKALRDRNNFRAMLVARSIMSGLEVNRDELDLDNEDTSAIQMLEKLNLLSPDEETESIEDLNVELNIEEIEIPLPTNNLVEPIQMQRFLVKIYWGQGPDDSFEITYYVPSDPS